MNAKIDNRYLLSTGFQREKINFPLNEFEKIFGNKKNIKKYNESTLFRRWIWRLWRLWVSKIN